MAAGGVIKVVFVALAALFLLGAAQGQSGGWRTGRATFYGDEPWLWDIHK